MQGWGFWPDRWWLNCWLYATDFQIGFNKLSYFISLGNSRIACSSFLSHRNLPAIHLLNCESFFHGEERPDGVSGQTTTAGPRTSPQASGWQTPVEAAKCTRAHRERSHSHKKLHQPAARGRKPQVTRPLTGDDVKIREGECLRFQGVSRVAFLTFLDFIPAWRSRVHPMLV